MKINFGVQMLPSSEALSLLRTVEVRNKFVKFNLNWNDVKNYQIRMPKL